MKNCVWILFTGLVLCCIPRKSTAQSYEAMQLILNYEKLNQLKKILQNMYEGYRVISQGYNKVKDITSGNYKLHQVFLDGLMAVSPQVRNYYKVGEIISMQQSLISEYKHAYAGFKQGGWFNEREIGYMGSVYKDLFDRSVKNLDELMMVITASKLRMSDDERLKAIDRIHVEVTGKLNFLRDFNNQTGVLQAQRLREQQSIDRMKALHDLE